MIPTRSFGPTPSGLTLRRVGPTAEPLSQRNATGKSKGWQAAHSTANITREGPPLGT